MSSLVPNEGSRHKGSERIQVIRCMIGQWSLITQSPGVMAQVGPVCAPWGDLSSALTGEIPGREGDKNSIPAPDGVVTEQIRHLPQRRIHQRGQLC